MHDVRLFTVATEFAGEADVHQCSSGLGNSFACFTTWCRVLPSVDPMLYQQHAAST
jgi:hypothetical protein